MKANKDKTLDRLSRLLEQHAEHCVEAAIESGDPEEQRAKFDELIGLLQKASR